AAFAADAAYQAAAAPAPLGAAFDPLMVGAVGAGALAVAAIAWALRVTNAARSASATWTHRLAEMEARREKAEGVLAAHPGLVLVWEEGDVAPDGWGAPKILGGPAALASLMSLAGPETGAKAPAIDRLLTALADLPVDDDVTDQRGAGAMKFRERVRELRAHGIAFSGSMFTQEGRAIEVDGRVAGGQVALWLTDPAVRLAEDGGLMGRIRENTAGLHAALGQLERAPMPAWRRDADLNLIWANAAYASAVEAESPAAALKDRLELDVAARRIAERAARDRRAADGRVSVNVAGARRVFHVVEAPAHASGDAAICGFAIDVTDLEAAQDELKRHIDANRRTLDQVPAAMALFGPARELAYYNAAFHDLWRLDPSFLDAKPMHEDVLDRLRHAGRLPEQADYRAWRARELALYAQEAHPDATETEASDDVWALPDGRTLRVRKFRHPMGGALLAFEDITEKLRLEALYNTQIKVQRATLDNLSEGVATFAANGALELHNRAFMTLWRLDEADLADHPHIDRVLATLRERAPDETDALADLRRKSTSMSADDRSPIVDGALRLADGRTLAYGTQPLPDGATLAHFLDVTDNREREKELKERNALLEDIDRQKSRFVDHVSYQLRTPLNTIIGFTEMLDGQMFGVLNDRQSDYVASILTASYTLKDLIADIMDLAAIDAGKLSLDLGPVDVRELLTSAATYAALKAEDTQVGLKVDCPKEIGAIMADGRRLKQVLFNLLSNAFTYTSAGGEVRLEARRTPELVCVSVTDSGRGVSPEDQARAFEAFEASGPSAGAGLGLALVQRLVNLHGGWVRLSSASDEGTRVECFLPAAAAPAVGSSANGPASEPNGDDATGQAAASENEGDEAAATAAPSDAAGDAVANEDAAAQAPRITARAAE
ncbi:MAG: ATP-binding protein, partial [Parvularculaceae bacterium]